MLEALVDGDSLSFFRGLTEFDDSGNIEKPPNYEPLEVHSRGGECEM